MFQFVQSRIKFTPLGACEKGPFNGVLETVVILALAAPRDLGARPPDLDPVKNGMVPGPIIGSLANGRIQFAPGTCCDRFLPAVKVSQDQAQAPETTGVGNGCDKRQRLLNPGVCL